MTMETMPLLAKPKAPASKQLESVVVQSDGSALEREWDGPLFKMCGDCDQAGLSTYAYVRLCPSLAWGYFSLPALFIAKRSSVRNFQASRLCEISILKIILSKSNECQRFLPTLCF